jgi:hypothetical protein
MFKMTSHDLAKKSDAQLSALFQEVSIGLVASKAQVALAQSLLAMINSERSKRSPAP